MWRSNALSKLAGQINKKWHKTQPALQAVPGTINNGTPTTNQINSQIGMLVRSGTQAQMRLGSHKARGGIVKTTTGRTPINGIE